ncbi:unnamed protein product [Arabis nemorensis]|uniref:SURP motif domain-containing protein n=1 Tax=Arabis nemorensis TaxID=586526 RepID=A0A565AZ36_9BRAS|nr:unnamed protein product [Arabis nemorensis]
MSSSDSRDSHFFSDVWDTYIRLEDGWGTATAMLDLHAFMGGVDCFAYMDDVEFLGNMPPSETVSMMVNRLREMQPDTLVHLPVGSVRDAQYDVEPSPSMFGDLFPLCWNDLKELGIMKLTALFVARYGAYFCWELTKKVVMKPQFNFMNPTDSKFRFYNQIVDAY